MRALLETCWLREDGQDLVEYSLLLAFVIVLSAALVLYNSDAVANIWHKANNQLDEADSRL